MNNPQLQEAINDAAVSCDKTLDLCGMVAFVNSIQLSSQHDGLKIKNGSIVGMPVYRGRVGLIEICRNCEWAGKTYDDKPINLTFEDLTFQAFSNFANWTDYQPENDKMVTNAGMRTAAINVVRSGRPDVVEIKNCRAYSLSSGFLLGASKYSEVRGCMFARIANHCLGVLTLKDNDRRQACNYVDCVGRGVGTAFDFTIATADKAASPPVIPFASVRNLNFENVTGRTKIHGPWGASIYNSNFRQTRWFPNSFGALNFPGGKDVLIDKCIVENFFFAGIATTNNQQITEEEKPRIHVAHCEIENSMNAFIPQYPMEIRHMKLTGCYRPFPVPGMRPEVYRDVTETYTGNVAKWRDIQKSMDDVAKDWETDYGNRPRWTVPSELVEVV